nr:hypothetical protein [Tanacetum cinerariifolium]
MSLFHQRQCHGCSQPCDEYYCESCTCPQCGMTLFNRICDNCIYEVRMPIICTACGGIVRGGLCLPCDLREKNLYNCDPNAYSFYNSNYFPQPQYENYLCNLCGNNSHDGYDCQQQFPFVYEQEPSYNQNYDDNYYPHESLSFPCCDYCGGSHETFQCQPDNQNVDFSGSDQIQTPQYLVVNPPSPEIKSDEVRESNAENLLPILSKCEVTLEDEIECDMPAKDDCSPVFTTFSNPLFKDDDNFDSSDDESLPDEDVPAEEFKIYLNPLCDEDKINSHKLDPRCFNVESDFVESLLNRDTFIDFSSIFDFSNELAHIKPEIPKFDFDFEEEIRCNSQQEEIDIVTETDDVLPPSIENFADDPEGDIHFLEELLIDDSILSDELSDANFEENPLILRPPPKPPDVETDAREEIAVVMIDKDKFDDDYQIFMFDKVFSLLSAESEDTIFDPGISD